MESGLKHALKREAALRSLKNVILSSFFFAKKLRQFEGACDRCEGRQLSCSQLAT